MTRAVVLGKGIDEVLVEPVEEGIGYHDTARWVPLHARSKEFDQSVGALLFQKFLMYNWEGVLLRSASVGLILKKNLWPILPIGSIIFEQRMERSLPPTRIDICLLRIVEDFPPTSTQAL